MAFSNTIQYAAIMVSVMVNTLMSDGVAAKIKPKTEISVTRLF